MRYRIRRMVALIGLFAIFGLVGTARAQSALDTFTLQPGSTATITFESFCIDFGNLFPARVGVPRSVVAEPAVVGALSYALSKGYTSSQPLEVQYAIWKARGVVGSPATGTVGQEVTANANAVPSAPAGATSVVDAINNQQVRATLGPWQGIGEKLTMFAFDDFFQGRGTLVVENISSQPLTLYMPVGTLFPAPGPEFQNMAGYATKIETRDVPLQVATDTPTTAATETPAPTDTAAPTATATATTAPTATATAVITSTATTAAIATPEATATTAPTTVQHSVTPEITPTTAETPATEATATTAPAPTPTVEVKPAVVPDTGVIRLSPLAMIILILLALDILAWGYSVRRLGRR